MGLPAAENGAATLDRTADRRGTGTRATQEREGFECRLSWAIAANVPAVGGRDFSNLEPPRRHLRVSFENYVSDVDRGSDSF